MVVGNRHTIGVESAPDLGPLASGASAGGWGPPRFTGEEYEAVEAAIDAARQAPHVQAALRAMPVGDRKILELVAYGQLRPSEAALALGISPNAARLRLARARKRLREQLLAADPSAGLAAPTTEVSSHDH